MNDGRVLRIIDGLLTPEECERFIRVLDNEDLILVDRGDLATYQRGLWISEAFADELYRRLQPHLPADVRAEVVRCNEYFRFSKYEAGQEFKLHTDGTNLDRLGNVSQYTVNIFLNSEFEGGETDFFQGVGSGHTGGGGNTRALPLVGRAAVFDRGILHCGNRVISGVKYLLRTDLMVPLSGGERAGSSDVKVVAVPFRPATT